MEQARVRRFTDELPLLAIAAAALGGAVLLEAGDNFALNILATTFLMAGLATSWNVIGGFGGQFSLCHGVFFAEGAYLTANGVVHFGISPWLSLLPAALLGAVTALAISWPAFRLRGPFFAIATMTFSEVAYVLANYFDSVTGGAQGIRVPFRAGWANMIFPGRIAYAWIMLGFLFFCLACSLFLLRSRLGYYLQAVRDNEAAAQASGIDVLRTKLSGFAISAGLTAIGGSLFMMYVRVVDPPTLLTLSEVGVRFALIALIGGVGTGYGPLLGALLVVPLEAWLRAALGAYVPGSNLVVLGAVLILAALFFRQGIAGAIEGLIARRRAASA
ncbi:MAG TPA: branched-chain amino acid ABC transporter permease [Acetobacteraceae bacterium]|nr:branched-chain amino acid ABC transporter permease [Acetobacteraceae bacterium]